MFAALTNYAHRDSRAYLANAVSIINILNYVNKS
jgi:hypothetical protein